MRRVAFFMNAPSVVMGITALIHCILLSQEYIDALKEQQVACADLLCDGKYLNARKGLVFPHIHFNDRTCV